MASPFKVFRKHQKVLIATLGLLAMIAFVFLTNVQRFSGGGTRQNPVVVTTTAYGDLREYDLHSLRQQRLLVLKFLDLLQQAVLANGGTGTAVQEIKNALGREPRTEQAVVDTWLAAERAKQLGLVVSDQAINDFIRHISEDRVHGSQLTKRSRIESREQGIFQQVGVGGLQMFELLRHELLALRLRSMFLVSLEATTPAQRWDYFNRLQRKVTIELIPVPVTDYVSKVTREPNEAELQTLFEQYQEKEPDPMFPEPGFRTPHKIAVSYFKAELEKFAAPDEVTEDEIKKYYQENKERFDRMDAASEEQAAEKKDEPSAEKDKETESAEKAQESAAEGKESSGEEAESGKEAAEPEGKSDDSDQTGAAGRSSPFVPVSLRQEETVEELKEPVPQPPQATEGKPDESGDKEDQSDRPAEDGRSPEGSTSKAPWEGPIGETIRRELAQKAAGKRIEEIFDRLQAEMNQYRKLYTRYDAMREEDPNVRAPKRLDFKARAEKAGLTAGMLAARDPETGKLLCRHPETGKLLRRDPEREELIRRTRQADESVYDPQTGELVPLSLLVPLSQLEAQQLDIVRSFVNGDWRLPFLRYAYEESWPEYKAAKSSDILGNRYLFWKVKDAKEKIPKFDDPGVHEQVLEAWKMIQARRLAIERAEALRDQARKTGKSLKETFFDRPDLFSKVTITSPFSWMTYGSVPAETSRTPPRMSSVDGVEMPGRDFMRTVFDLGKGQVGVAMNQPKSIAYVVRVIEFNKSDTVLWDEFTADLTAGRYGTYAAAAIGDKWEVLAAWQEELKTEAGLKWNRKADRPWPE